MKEKINSKAFIFKVALLITFLTTIIVTTVMMGSKSKVDAATITDSNGVTWTFSYNSTTREISNLYANSLTTAQSENLVIPATITYGGIEYTVRNIGYGSSSSYYRFAASLKNVTIPDTVTKINPYAFYECRNLESVTIGSGVNEIGNYAFGYCVKLTGIELPEGLTTFGSYPFYGCSNFTGTMVFPKSAKTFGSNPLYGCSKVTGIKVGDEFPIGTLRDVYSANNIASIEIYDDSEVYKMEDGILFSKDGKRLFLAAKTSYNDYVVPEGVTSIENNAFRYTKSMSGTLTLPEGLQQIGNYAFYDKNGITGDLRIPDSVTAIGSNAFYNIKTFDRVTLGSGITRVEAYTFSELEDLFVNNVLGSVEFVDNFCVPTPVVHFLNSTKHVTVSKAPGIKLINVETGAEVETGDYIDETTFRYRIEIENGYNYNNLQLVWYDDGKYENFTNEEVVLGREYEFTPLLRTRNIYVQNLNDTVDLSLRTFITEVNRAPLSKSRVPEVVVNESFEYLHTKEPVKVKKGDLVTYKVRIYNEALQIARATEITVHIPEGMTFDAENATNKNYGWLQEGNTIKTSQLAFDDIHSYLGNGVVSYKDVDICLTVNEDSTSDEIYKTVFAEITGMTGTDADSTLDNVTVSDNYRIDEIINSNSSSFIVDQEDDDDFDTVVLNSKIRVEYNLRIEKIDKDTDELLAGAKFELLSAGVNELVVNNELKRFEDEEVIATATSDENGIVDFGGITTYSEGENIFWVKEIDAPLGYLTNIGKKMKVKVVKTILDEEVGTYSVKVYCESSDYAVDTSHFEFTPVSTAEQLAKMGSGETVNVDGVDYEYNIDTNYKLVNDIDLAGINWTPIDKSLVGIIDGDGHKISNLTIELDPDATIAKVGLIGEFTGIIENLTLENPNIHMTTLAEGVTDTTDYYGVGGFVGFMHQGYFYNCKTTVTEGTTASITASIDNIGGFVGHTAPNGLVTIINSENNVDVIGAEGVNEIGLTEVPGTNNVGGMIGCALGSISIQNSKNTGTISCGQYGAGGLVGFVRPTDYEELSITAGYDEDNKRIDLLVENEAAKGRYNLTLEIRDRKTARLIGGAIYEVDRIEDNIKTALLDTGTLKLFDKEIEYTGRDVYFMTEEETVPGYDLLNGIIRVDITRYWDNESNEYKVRAEANIVTHKDYLDFIESRSTNEDEARTGKIFDKGSVFTEVNIERANWNGCKVEIANCVNDGAISASVSNAGGMIGTAYGVVTIDECTNNAEVKGNRKSAGMVAEVKAVNDTYTSDKKDLPQESLDYSMITNCTNNGKIIGVEEVNNGAYGAVGGLAAEIMGFAKITNGTNNGEITSKGQQTGGILGKSYGAIIIEDSTNNGKISIASSRSYSDDKAIGGGILGEGWIDEYHIEAIKYAQVDSTIRNCNNYGDVYSDNGYDIAGIAAKVTGHSTTIENCQVIGESDENKLKIYVRGQGETGGIVGLANCRTTTITDCKIKNVDIQLLDDNNNNHTYRTMAGILAICDMAGSPQFRDMYSSETARKATNISNCSVDNCTIIGKGKEVSGIMGINQGAYGNIADDYMSDIKDCTVKNSLIANYNEGGGYVVVSGIYAGGYQLGGYNIKYCNVEGSRIETRGYTEDAYGSTSTSTVAGIFGRGMYAKSQNIEECNVTNCTLYSKTPLQGSTGCTGGIYGVTYGVNKNLDIRKCNVKNTEIIEHNANVGGLLGGIMNSGYGSTGDNGLVTIEECNVIETNINRLGTEAEDVPRYGNYSNDGCVGGIAGSIQDMNSVTIKNVNVTGKEIAKDAENANQRNTISAKYGNVGGAIGMARNNNLQISNVAIKNYDVINGVDEHKNVYQQSQLGGFLGSAWYGGSKVESYKDILIENVNVKGNKTQNTGGFAANFYTYDGSKIENVKVKNTNISSEYTYEGDEVEYGGVVAGIVACNGLYSIYENCDVEDCIITSKHHIAAGGIGHNNDGAIIKNCSVKNVEIIDAWEEPENIEDTVDLLGKHRVFGGFVGVNPSQKFELDGINVSNVDISAKYASIGGVYGWTSGVKKLDNCVVDNCEFVATKSISGVKGACAGLGADTKTMSCEPTNNKVSNVQITTDNHINAGAFGFIKESDRESITINNTTVENVTLTHENKELLANNYDNADDVPGLRDYNPTIAGVVGITSDDITINTATVKNATLTAKYGRGMYTHMGGIIALTGHNINIDNAKVSRINITNNVGGGITGGLVGINSYLETDSGNPSPVTTITNSSIEQDSTITASNNFGGMVGFATVQMDKNKVLDTTLKANGYSNSIGGVLGLGKYGENSISNTTIRNLSIPDGEFIGANVGGVTSYYLNGNINNTTMTDSEIYANNCAGGLVGIVYTPTDEINNVTITGSTIISKGSHAGGVAAIANGPISNVTISDTTVQSIATVGGIASVNFGNIDEVEMEDITITSTGEGYGHFHAGGVTGVGLKALSNISVKDATITAKMQAGGVAGVAPAGGISNVEIDNAKVTSTTEHAGGVASCVSGVVKTIRIKDSTIVGKQMAGGVAGWIGGATSDVKVNNTNVTGIDDAGGIAGVTSSTITDAEVNESTIKATRLAGGIVGTTENEIKDAIVDGSTITSEELHAGGIVSCTKEKLNNCKVKDSTIKTLTGTFSTGVNVLPTCLGGLVGTGYKDQATNELKPQIVNSTVENNTLTGATGTSVGKYIGGPIELNDELVAAETTQP